MLELRLTLEQLMGLSQAVRVVIYDLGKQRKHYSNAQLRDGISFEIKKMRRLQRVLNAKWMKYSSSAVLCSPSL